jgi:hypothetical protein
VLLTDDVLWQLGGDHPLSVQRRRIRAGRPWAPRSLSRLKDTSGLFYVVVDEMDERSVRLSVSPWPVVDKYGRLRFHLLGETLQVGAPRRALQLFLNTHRLPSKGAKRPLRIGDVFAVRGKGSIPATDFPRPEDWMQVPVHDITADAREAAKASFYAAVAPTLRPQLDRAVIALAQAAPPPHRSRPRPRGA